jgi:hypothetical protein
MVGTATFALAPRLLLMWVLRSLRALRDDSFPTIRTGGAICLPACLFQRHAIRDVTHATTT